MYKPIDIRKMVTSATHLKPVYTTEFGRDKKTYAAAANPNLKGYFKQKGSSDIIANGVLLVNTKTTFTTWYKGDIESGDAIQINGIQFAIKGNPEDVEMRHRYMILDLERIDGGV